MMFGKFLLIVLIVLCLVAIWEIIRLIDGQRYPLPKANVRPVAEQAKKMREAAWRKKRGKDVVFLKNVPSDLDGSGYGGE